MSFDSKVIETEAPKNDMITVDLKTQDTQLNLEQNPMPKKVTKTDAPKDDMMTVNLNIQDTQLNPKPNPISKKTMTPRHKFKRIKKGGKVQKIQSLGVHKMKFKPFHKITDSQITPIKSPNISCDSTVLDMGIPKSDSTKMDLEVQDTTQNPMPKKVIETEAPKNDTVTVNLNTQDTQLNPKPNPMPKKTMTPRYKSKKIRKKVKFRKFNPLGSSK